VTNGALDFRQPELRLLELRDDQAGLAGSPKLSGLRNKLVEFARDVVGVDGGAEWRVFVMSHDLSVAPLDESIPGPRVCWLIVA